MQIWLNRKIDNYHLSEYSNEDDFPYHFVKRVAMTPWLAIVLCWLIFFTENRLLMAVTWLGVSVLSVYYTIVILHPQRKMVFADTSCSSDLSDPKIESVRTRVIEICRRRYLEPHITRREIISEFDYGSRTLAGQVITQYGFYAMINTLRLEHARIYAQAHPRETKESVAVNSGFKDRFAMRHAERKIGDGILDMLRDFTPPVS